MPRKQDSLPGHMSRHAIAVIEFARSILGLQDANCTEFDTNTHNPCVIFMPEIKGSKAHISRLNIWI